MCDLDESRTQIFSETFQIFSSLTDRAPGPCFQTPKDEDGRAGENQHDQRQRSGPGDFCRRQNCALRVQLPARESFRSWTFSFSPKKVPPPTPDGREGRLFPPEQSSKIWSATTRA